MLEFFVWAVIYSLFFLLDFSLYSGLSEEPFSVCLPLQVITLEGWVDIMYFVMDAHSFYNFIYFILLIIVSATSCGSVEG